MDSIVFILLAAALIGVAFYLVALPLLQAARRTTAPETVSSEQERLTELLAQRDAAFQALRELNFDHRMGKIADEDFAAFEANLKRHAAETLRALDAWEAEADDELDAEMERAIRERAAERKAAGTQGQPLAGGRVCPQCNTPAAPGDRFCAGCGAPLAAPAPVQTVQKRADACPGCGQPYQSGDKFCGRCGKSLTVEAASVAR